ncbi:MAG: magnesium transporter CorA family protein [Acidimicrobiia bacterium]|nr:magnesium transporter CorA family protein [Acidimicrobiia bacterium]
MIRAIEIGSSQARVMSPEPTSTQLQWIDLEESGPDRLFEIAADFGVGHATVDSILTDPDRPMIDSEGEHLHVALHSLGLDEADRPSTVEYDLILGTSWIMTIRNERIPVIDWLWAELENGIDFDLRTPIDLMSVLALYGTRRFPPIVDAVASQADILGVNALSGTRGILFEIQSLLRTEVVLRTTLRAQRGVMEQLAADATTPGSAARERFTDAAVLHHALVDELLTARTILSDAVNTYRGAVAERTGDVTRVLTVYAAVVLPMSLVAGIWGMNVAGLPFATSARGFLAVLAVMLVVGLGSTLAFIRFGYLSPSPPPGAELVKNLLVGMVRLPIRAIRPGSSRRVGPR